MSYRVSFRINPCAERASACQARACIGAEGFIHSEESVRTHLQGPEKRFREMIAAHGGGHGRGLPGLAPIRNSCKLRGLCCRSCFGPRTCGRGITNIPKRFGLSIRVSPSHPYYAGRAGLGWMRERQCRQGRTRMDEGAAIAACSGCVVVLALGESATCSLVRRPRGGRSAFY